MAKFVSTIDIRDNNKNELLSYKFGLITSRSEKSWMFYTLIVVVMWPLHIYLLACVGAQEGKCIFSIKAHKLISSTYKFDVLHVVWIRIAQWKWWMEELSKVHGKLERWLLLGLEVRHFCTKWVICYWSCIEEETHQVCAR